MIQKNHRTCLSPWSRFSTCRKVPLAILIAILPILLFAQIDTTKSKLSLDGDFRFRIEQDWNSKNSDGSFRDDRTRLRYRLRFGVHRQGEWYKTGFRLRTGNPRKQQDPQLTLGEGFKEFGTLPIALEKAYFEGSLHSYQFSFGKNTFPFQSNNELFWSENVYPEGVYLGRGFSSNSSIIDSIEIRAGHFILSASGRSFNLDSYFQGYQLYLDLFNNRFQLFPSFYIFNQVPNILDGAGTFDIDYQILHIGSKLRLLKNRKLDLELNYYRNIKDYARNDSIPSKLADQKTGLVVGLGYGSKANKGDWCFKASYAYLQRYSAVDIMAQNDWARWDYSDFDSPDGRLTNLQGIELVASYRVDRNAILVMKYYLVEQLVSYGISKENGNRIRLDIDVSF